MTLATLKRRIDAIAARLTAPDDDITIVIQWEPGETWNGQGEAPLMIVQPGMLEKLLPDGTEHLPYTATPDDQVTATPAKEEPARYVYEPPLRPRKLFPHELEERKRNRRPNWKVS